MGTITMDEADIKLGERYRDTLTGFEGTAIAKHEYIHGCTRVTLQAVVRDEIKDYAFDAPALEEVGSGATVTSLRTGGPRATPAPRTTG